MQPRPRPTRLINVQDSSRPFLQVMEEALEPYLALSYRWGENKKGQTLKCTYETFQHCLPLNDIPRTCWDAIQLTRMLGYKYLWIDAFCIIQNDETDKSHELVNMGDIYRYALFTIYAKRSSSSQSGLFARQDNHIKLEVSATTKQSAETAKITLASMFDGPDHLEGRGWVLQETVLSSRRLAFGNRMSWKCTMARADETSPIPRARHNALTDGFAGDVEKLRLWMFAPARMRETPRQSWLRWNQFDSWYAIVEAYSVTSLTFVSDNLPALSGLAKLLQQAHGATYAAGLWTDDLQVGLTWYVASNDERKVPRRRDMAPSWSWAAVGKVRIKFRSWPSKSVHIVSEGVELLEASCVPEIPLNPYGAINKGKLKLRIRLRKALLRCSADYTRSRFEYNHVSGLDYQLFGNIDSREQPRYFGLILDIETNQVIGEAALDAPIHLNQRPVDGLDVSQEIELSPLSSLETEVWCGLVHVQKKGERHILTALILEPELGSVLVYRRLGVLFLTDRSWFGPSSSALNRFDEETGDVFMDVIDLV
ncbi:Uncharacterized protein BP5553_05059 [Venustampulla echinocandica]|uniref:Heterokaryon incompatibility domain-containing protein n=1 Tax=Venustampulla echinocandica TaxID=2656787 RepID=A0A370TQ26_9HELO|nr:Uncharacterized protein BP5553_05059 [Venustampulla echinocandica]RDL37626.1 Uncharacterized protein BP5553_05059 [Venustampulla echinocandica]